MTMAPRVRRSIQDLQDEFDKGNKKPLEDVMRAWKGIKELPPDDPRSFFVLGGYHGEPFRGAGWELAVLGRILQSWQYPVSDLASRVFVEVGRRAAQHSGLSGRHAAVLG